MLDLVTMTPQRSFSKKSTSPGSTPSHSRTVRYRPCETRDFPCVITSYSIHYTKLYDPVPNLAQEHRGILDITGLFENAGGGLTEILKFSHRKGFFGTLEEELPEQVVVLENRLPLEIFLGRITSYNVCYTKLLRHLTLSTYGLAYNAILNWND